MFIRFALVILTMNILNLRDCWCVWSSWWHVHGTKGGALNQDGEPKDSAPSFLLLLKMVDKSWLENMKLFEFLNKLDSENIKYEIDYKCSSWISVKIIMRDKYWLVSFD